MIKTNILNKMIDLLDHKFSEKTLTIIMYVQAYLGIIAGILWIIYIE